MAARTEIGWTTIDDDGNKRHACARHFGGKWTFFERPKRKGADIQWIPLDPVPLTDWLELLDAVERRSVRDLHPPEEVQRIRRAIRENYPEHPFD